MLSASSSFIATNCPDLILLANFAPIGGSAEERITAPSVAGLRLEQDGLALKAVMAVAVAPAVTVAALWQQQLMMERILPALPV